MKMMDASINFRNLKMDLPGVKAAQLNIGETGHLQLPMRGPELRVCATQTESNWTRIGDGEPKSISSMRETIRAHRHLGHASEASMEKIVRLSGRVVDSSLLKNIIEECGCIEIRPMGHVSSANQHLARYPGHSVFVDICYPLEETGHRFPPHIVI